MLDEFPNLLDLGALLILLLLCYRISNLKFIDIQLL